MGFSLDKYIDHLGQIQFYNYSIIVNYYDLRFTFENTIPSILYTLEIYGVVDLVETKEYLIYSRQKTNDHSVWNVRIPEIQNSQNTKTNPKLVELGVNSPSNNISVIPEQQYIAMGSDYISIHEGGPTNPNGLPDGQAIKVYLSSPTVTVLRTPDNQGHDRPYGNEITLHGPKYIPVNTNERIKNYVSDNYRRFNTHPTIKLESPDFNQDNGIYYEIPLGLSKYKVVLRSANGEKVTFNMEGTLQNNRIYAPVPPLSSSFSNVPGVDPGGDLIIDNDILVAPSGSEDHGLVPDLIGLNIGQARNAIIVAGFVPAANPVFTEPQDLPSDADYYMVHSQQPWAGSFALEGSVIHFYYFSEEDHDHQIHWHSNGYSVDTTCFEGSCRVKTPKGDVPISQLKNGDLIYTIDDDFNLQETILTDIRCVKHRNILQVYLKNGNSFKMTHEQPLLGTTPNTIISSISPSMAWISFNKSKAEQFYPELGSITEVNHKTAIFVDYKFNLVEVANTDYIRENIDTYQVAALSKGNRFIVEDLIAPVEISATKIHNS